MIKEIKQALLHRKIKKHLRFIQSIAQIRCFAEYLENTIFFHGETMIIEIGKTKDVFDITIKLQESHCIVLSIKHRVDPSNNIEIIEINEYTPGEWEEQICDLKCAYEYYSFREKHPQPPQ